MKTVRIALCGMPRLLSGIVREAFASPPFEIVGRTESCRELEVSLDELDPNVVVFGCERSASKALGERFLRSRPSLKTIAIVDDGEAARLLELWPRVSESQELSPSSLRKVVEEAVSGVDSPWPKESWIEAGS